MTCSFPNLSVSNGNCEIQLAECFTFRLLLSVSCIIRLNVLNLSESLKKNGKISFDEKGKKTVESIWNWSICGFLTSIHNVLSCFGFRTCRLELLPLNEEVYRKICCGCFLQQEPERAELHHSVFHYRVRERKQSFLIQQTFLRTYDTKASCLACWGRYAPDKSCLSEFATK